MIPALRELIANVGLQLVDHLIGTNTAGAMPLTIPVYDAGATPTIVY